MLIIDRIYQELAYSKDLPSWMIPYSWPAYLILGFIILVLAKAFKNLLIQSEYKFDQRSKIYFRDGRAISPFSEIKGVDIRIFGSSGIEVKGPTYFYPLNLILKDGNLIKLFTTASEHEARSFRTMIRKLLGLKDEVLTSEERLDESRTSDWTGFIFLSLVISFVITGISIKWQESFLSTG